MVRDGHTLAPLHRIEEPGWRPGGAAFSPDGRYLAVLSTPSVGTERWRRGRLVLWRTAGWVEVASVPARRAIEVPMAWSHDGRTLAVGGYGRGEEAFEVPPPALFSLQDLGLTGGEP